MKAKAPDGAATTDRVNPHDLEPRVAKCYIEAEGGALTEVYATHDRPRTIQVNGVVYTHTHDAPDGTWVFRHFP